MCASDPQVRSQLRPCRRRLVSADSSPLTVKGELKMTIVFPGLSCDMLLVVAKHNTPVVATSAGFANGAIVGVFKDFGGATGQ